MGGVVAALDLRCMVDAFDVGDSYRGDDNVLHQSNHFMAHCMAACLSTRCLPRCSLLTLRLRIDQGGLTLLAGAMMELWQTTPWGKTRRGGWGNDYWLENTGWNVEGVACGLGGTTCFQCCYAKARKHGGS